MIALAYLAINPNISAQEFSRLAEKYAESKKRQLQMLEELIEKTPDDEKAEVTSAFIRILMAY